MCEGNANAPSLREPTRPARSYHSNANATGVNTLQIQILSESGALRPVGLSAVSGLQQCENCFIGRCFWWACPCIGLVVVSIFLSRNLEVFDDTPCIPVGVVSQVKTGRLRGRTWKEPRPMYMETKDHAPKKLGRPNDETIAQEKQKQDATLIALRRMLAEGTARRELVLFNGAA